jgi:integrase
VGDVLGTHVAPNKRTFKSWVEDWLALKGKATAAQSIERYATALHTHAVPVLGSKALQKITATDLDKLFGDLAKTLAPRSLSFVHMVVKAATAVKKKHPAVNPANEAEKPPTDDSEAATTLDEEELAKLVQGFRGTSIYLIVCLAAYTGMRRNEVLALRWIDIDLTAKTISVTRSVERTKQHGRRVKGPKSARGNRTIQIDDQLVALLRSQRDLHLRIVVGIADGTDVDLSLVKLPEGALVFPAIKGSNLTTLQSAESVTNMFVQYARKLGFDMRFHDLRGTHATALLDKGVPVHVVAKRIGDDPATLLRWYAKRTKKSDTATADIIGTMTKGVL